MSSSRDLTESWIVPSTPAYLRIAADLRAQIASGEIPAGGKLPTESALMETYAVSRTVAKNAIIVLKTEGLVEGRQGSGVYVRAVRRMTRMAHGAQARRVGGSLFEADARRAGHTGTWRHRSERTTADVVVARRLGIPTGDPVMRTEYVFLADDQPIQLSTSWEPLAITDDTDITWPEDGAATGVVARMDHIGVHITEFLEQVTHMAAGAEEIDKLKLPARGAPLFRIERTYFAGDIAVETADIIFPTDRYELVYRVPVED